jgi:hypothetical protein
LRENVLFSAMEPQYAFGEMDDAGGASIAAFAEHGRKLLDHAGRVAGLFYADVGLRPRRDRPRRPTAEQGHELPPRNSSEIFYARGGRWSFGTAKTRSGPSADAFT